MFYYQEELSVFKRLEEIESVFFDQIKSASLLGQIYLNEQDIEHLVELFLNDFDSKRNLNYFKIKFPISVSLMLLNIGKKNYVEGNFWEPIYKKLKITERSHTWNSKFGDVFYHTIDKYNLSKFDTGRNIYVNQILAHSFIPDKYLEQYFKSFLYDKFNQFLNLAFTKKDIANKLENIREDHKGYIDRVIKLEEILLEMKRSSETIKKFKLCLDNFTELNKLTKLLDKMIDTKEMNNIINMPDNYLEKTSDRYHNLKSEIENYRRKYEKNDLKLKEVNHFITMHENKKKTKILLEKQENELSNKIKEEYLKIIEAEYNKDMLYRIDSSFLSELKYLINERNKYQFNKELKTITNKLGYLFHLLKKPFTIFDGRRKRIDTKLKKIMSLIPIKEIYYKSPSHNVYDKLEAIKKMFEEKEKLKKNIKKIEEEISAIDATNKPLSLLDAESYYKKRKHYIKKKNELKSKINEFENDYEKLFNKLRKYKMSLNILAKDKGIEEGLNVLNQERQRRKEIKEIKTNLDIDKEILNQLIKEIKENNKNEIERKLKHVRAERRELYRKRKEIKKELEAYPNRFYDVNEPIVIFLTQGGKLANEFVYNSLKILQKIKNDKFNIDKEKNRLLPEKFCVAMENWWLDFSKQMSVTYTERENYKIINRNPYLYYFQDELELKIIIPEQTAIKPQKINMPELFLKDYKGNTIKRLQLDLFEHEEDLIKTEEKVMNFPKDSNEVKVELLLNENIIFQEEFVRSPWYLLKNGKVTNINPFEYEQLEMILEDGYYLNLDDSIIQQVKMAGNWKGFSHYYIDISQNKLITIYKDDDKIIKSFKKYDDIEPTLEGGNLSKKIIHPDINVYSEKLPYLLFSLDNYKKLRLWQLVIRNKNSDKEVKFNLIDEIDKLNFENKDNLVQISLNLIIGKLYGEYNIDLIRRAPYTNSWSFSFVYLPEYNIDFNKKNYYVTNPKEIIAKIHYSLPENFYLVAKENNLVKEQNQKKGYIRCYPEANNLPISFVSKEKENTFTLDLMINIPLITCFISSEESELKIGFDREEIWVDEIFSQEKADLIIKIPEWNKPKKIQLILNDNEQIIEPIVKRNLLKFNLLRFSDVIRNSLKPVQDFHLVMFIKNETKTYHLFSVRTKWEVCNFDVNLTLENNYYVIKLKWEEKGKESHKRLLIWNKDMNDIIFSDELHVDTRELELKFFRDKFVPGSYIFQFKKAEAWGISKPIMPDSEKDNNFEVILGKKEDFISLIKNKGLIIKYVENEEGNKHSFSRKYKVNDIKEVSELKFEGEERYRGKLLYSEKNEKDIIHESSYNPISFYFDEREKKLPLLVDKDNDGPQYCMICKKFFWDVIDKRHEEFKHSNKHFVPVHYYIEID